MIKRRMEQLEVKLRLTTPIPPIKVSIDWSILQSRHVHNTLPKMPDLAAQQSSFGSKIGPSCHTKSRCHPSCAASPSLYHTPGHEQRHSVDRIAGPSVSPQKFGMFQRDGRPTDHLFISKTETDLNSI